MFFIIPVGVDYDARRYPVVTLTFIGTCVVLYLVSLLFLFSSGGESFDHRYWIITHLGLIPAAPRVHAWLTCLFVHAGLFHLLGNMIYLYLFGACVEDMIGRGWFVLFYLLGGLVANVAHVVLSNPALAELPLVGASGAISACLGGFVVILAKTKINFRYFFFIFLRFWSGDFWLPAWLVISAWFLKDVVFAVLSGMNAEAGGGVAFAAHVGGFISGFACMLLYRALTKTEVVTEKRIPVSAMAPSRRLAAIPVAEVPSIYLYESELQTGPFTVAQVRAMKACGSISEQAYYCRVGMSEWRSVQELE